MIDRLRSRMEQLETVRAEHASLAAQHQVLVHRIEGAIADYRYLIEELESERHPVPPIN